MHVSALLAGAIGTLVFLGSALGHHSAAAFFDLDATVSVEGVVTGARLANPHSYYRVTTDEDVDWAWESAGTWTALAKAGWSAETLPVGTRVRMNGTPALTGRPIARFTLIVASEEGSDDVMLLVGLDVFGRGRPAWFTRAQELGRPCANGVTDCTRLAPDVLEALEEEFGSIEGWSERDE